MTQNPEISVLVDTKHELSQGKYLVSISRLHQRIHEAVIEENKEKTPGTRYNPTARLQPVLNEVRTIPGIYNKAAALLKGVRKEHVFNDGNTTTAILVTIDFLHQNNKEFKPSDQNTIAKVANNYKYFTDKELAKWLQQGEIDEEKIPEY